MDKRLPLWLTRFLFYGIVSFILALSCYYILQAVMPGNIVYMGVLWKPAYHYEHPILYMLIPCFFYGIVATLFSDYFAASETTVQLILTTFIIILTILISLPFGGMLAHFHDMQADYFPENWKEIILTKGVKTGLEYGPFIILLSIPYNILGCVICFFLTRIGARLK